MLTPPASPIRPPRCKPGGKRCRCVRRRIKKDKIKAKYNFEYVWFQDTKDVRFGTVVALTKTLFAHARTFQASIKTEPDNSHALPYNLTYAHNERPERRCRSVDAIRV
ncbi:MAG: hypothetical protein QOJ99_3267 [Bryobacterales bacterium]|jgi:hypothetical protein|nr:hypothetical protein [Bryobacterales bacterium]